MIQSFIRQLLCFLIGLALAAAPIGSAHAALAMMQQSEAGAAMAEPADDMASMEGMTDCMKSMQQPAKDCDCCDSKAKCPDGGACLMKCSTQVLAVVVASAPSCESPGDTVTWSEPYLPPGWSSRPPAPPPRI